MVSATDVITYVGVPLAVLGVMPVLYTSARVLYTVRKIKHELKKSGSSATTRSGLMSGVVEVELPRYSLRPLPREDPSYWDQRTMSFPIKGSSWYVLNWDQLQIGHVVYRLQYSDELQHPQAEVEFSELLEFLIDRGAVPSPEGFRILRALGLRAPIGTILLLPPVGGGRDTVLKVTAPDSSEGHLSLTLTWKAEWNQRNVDSLPPWWVRIRGPPVQPSEEAAESSTANGKQPEFPNEKGTTSETETVPPENITSLVAAPSQTSDHRASTGNEAEKRPPNYESVVENTPGYRPSVRMHIGGNGVERVYRETPDQRQQDVVPIYHLLISEKEQRRGAKWFSCAATASADEAALKFWTFSIPEEIVELARKDTIPCGLMEIMGALTEEEVPKWRDKPNPLLKAHRFHNEMQKKNMKMNLERNLPPAQAAAARIAREAEERLEMMQNVQRDMQERKAEAEELKNKILSSPRLTTKVVAAANLKWLSQQHTNYDLTMQTAVHILLYRAIFEEDLNKQVHEMFDQWQIWHETGGMQARHIDWIADNRLVFSYVSCILHLIAETHKTTGISEDLRECVHSWSSVRLG
jgi:hypothetical protein